MLEVNRVKGYETTNNIDVGISSTKKTGAFSSFLGESESLNDIFERAAAKYNISVDLLKAVGKQESNFNPTAVSRCGAQGIMQLMPATAASLGVTDSFDPEQNIMGGAKYLAGLLDNFNGNVTFALAAYNAGGNNVKKYGGIPPFKETQDYVVKVTAYMQTGVEVPNATYATTRSFDDTISKDKGLSEELLKKIEELKEAFDYEDYLTFINLLINNKDLDNKEEEEAQKANSSSGSDYSSLNQINYSPAILNLLTSL
ncbi:lytic transglycosylase domain-containing protein [Candidatus Galacturonibacter soehngenii]|uniref:Lytic transglycosylase domain-containing protein n=1 Tax=Candidatus Galacturonatibacter soehngenii TaxID=2307010 RepID=A0A7V7UCF9_9FIRM|nr:lytic transglycosylase domain-containing protein [Candidatus Galacturonibacter soehngenii]KAB1439447.1 lytic transglycosylase domain-containing protein [Candidatus Galacturonibacter soehngenii]